MNRIYINKSEIYLIFLLLLQTWEGEAGPSGNRIIGPQQTPKNEFPWLVKIESRSIDGFSKSSCGGTLLNTRVVLSAAHCTFYYNQNNQRIGEIPNYMMTIYLGEHDTTIADGEQQVGISHYIVHPYYNDDNTDNDFAMIYLAREIQFTDTINQACLPQDNTAYYDNTAVVAAGWGAEEIGGMGTIRPKHVDLTTMSNQVCNSKITGQPLFGWPWVITDNMLCATGIRKGICQGDSGGPLMVKGDERTVIGVSSWVPKNTGCNENGNSPSVFAKVTSQLYWIKENAQDTC